MSLRIDTREFRKQAARLQDLRRWPDAGKFWATQARGVIREVVERTPPHKGGVRGIAAKRLGEGTVEADINKLFRPVTGRSGSGTLRTVAALEQIHTRSRNSRGRVGRSLGEAKHRVHAPILNRYRREKKKKVGYLAGGWNRAAARTGYKPPAWVWRHNTPGAVSLKISSRGIRFKATNRTSFASNLSNLERRVQSAINAQTGKIRRQADFLVRSAARRSGFRSRR